MKISIQHLTKDYRGHRLALDDLSLEIENGMFGLLGPNGAGKTTLMKILATLLEPTSGAVCYDDMVLGRDNRAIRHLLGYLPQTYGLYPNLTARELLDYMASLSGLPHGKERFQRIDALLEGVNLLPSAHQRVGSFSGGMRQRLGIAQALLANPAVLIVDEPTAGLDPEERIRFRNLLSRLSGDRIVILSTHIVADISSSCRDIALLDRGRVRFRGRPADLIETARGRVWSAIVDPAQVLEIESQCRVVSALRQIEGVNLRLLGDHDQVRHLPCLQAEAPTLEDTYLLQLGSGSGELS